MTIIPAIDIIDGKCVRLTKGDYSQKIIYNEDPLEVALQFEDAGIKRLHLVDLDGAKAGDVKNWKVLEKLAGKTRLVIDFSGGISSEKTSPLLLILVPPMLLSAALPLKMNLPCPVGYWPMVQRNLLLVQM